MLICNNCSHINDDGVERCVQCNMRDNFSYRHSGDHRSDELLITPAAEACRNCGSLAPGDGDRCLHCRFPLKLSARRTGRGEGEEEETEKERGDLGTW